MTQLILLLLQNLKEYKRPYFLLVSGMVIGIYTYVTIPEYLATAGELDKVEQKLEQKINVMSDSFFWQSLRTEEGLLKLEKFNYETKIDDLKEKGKRVPRELQDIFDKVSDRLEEVKSEQKELKNKFKRDR